MALGAGRRQPQDMTEHATHTPSIRRLERSSDRMIAGVCGGLGRYFELNPMFFRIGFLVLTLLSGAGLLVYLAAVLVIPAEGSEQSLAEQALAERRQRPWPLVGLAIVAVAIAVLISRATLWPEAGAGWALILIAGLIILWASRGGRRVGRLLWTLIVLAAIATAAVVTAIVVAFAWFDVSIGDGVGKGVYTPTAATDLKPSYDIGVGKLRIDLSALGTLTQPVHLRAKVGVGDLRIVVPRGVGVSVDAHAKVGDVRVLNQDYNGHDIRVTTPAGRLLTIDADVGAGQIEIERAGQ
jgi:phage shock protein PspC (stress-responsive transcriptional regulator)